jgi:AraC-like DNA-binding protein
MPSSAVRIFTDADEYAAAIRAATVEVTVTGRGHFAAQLTRIDFHRLWMQRFSESLPRILHMGIDPGRAGFMMPTHPGTGLQWSGVEVQSEHISRHREVDDAYHLSSGPARFGAMSLPMEDVASLSTMAGSELTPPRSTLMVAAPRSAMARLQRLHSAAGHLAETAPEIISNTDAAHGLEQLLVEALVGCLSGGNVGEDSAAQRHHELIMRRFSRLLEANPAQPLYIPEICKATGVSERTLRACCHEQLGIGPKRYLLLRRLNLARQALRKAAPGTVTVTDVATRYGFWHFGLFANHYRSLFGEAPSVTLHRQSG